MKEDEFKASKTGKVVWEPHGMYYRFEPNPLPINFEPSKKLGNALMETALVLGRLDGLSKKLTPEEIELLRLPFVVKEAQLSSEIEGTRATLSDVYKDEKQKEKDRQRALDIEEIKNYAKALEFGLEKIQNNISEELIRKIHKILLQGVRGADKEPGRYKSRQNAIGQREDTLETAKFVPASPQITPFLMKNLVEYIGQEDEVNILYKIAVTHYQFEAIHPFRDGNGRLGRLLIMLMICKGGILTQPLLYISEFFNRNRSTYTDLLYEVSSKGNIEDWLLFFLKALNAQANSSFDLIQSLDSYKDELQGKVQGLSKSPNMYLVVNILFRNPFVTIKDISKELNMTVAGAGRLVHKLEQAGILKELTGKKNRKIFVAKKIIEILEKDMKNNS